MEVIERLRRESAAFAAHDVRHAWLFGSAARGEKNFADVDILVEFNRPPGLLNYMGLKFRLEEMLGKPVDLVSKAACRERFYRHIEKELVNVA